MHKYFALVENDKIIKKERGGYNGLLFYWVKHSNRTTVRLVEISKDNLFKKWKIVREIKQY